MAKNIKMQNIFKLRKGEGKTSLCALALFVFLNTVIIVRFFDLFSKTGQGHWTVFVRNFIISGFDPITYSVITYWEPNYNVYRHPLLAFMVWPLSVLNTWLTDLTGLNLVQIITAVPLLFCAFYSFVFLRRIMKDIIELPTFEANMLSFMTFSFAYVMLSCMVPDHFCISMFCLITALYICGMKIKQGGRLKIWQTILLFFMTAGITLSNGVKIFIYALYTNGIRFFKPKYLFLAVLLPSALIWGFARWEYRTMVLPKEKARKAIHAKKNEEIRQKMFEAFKDTSSLKDSMALEQAFKQELNKRILAKYNSDKNKTWNKNTGRPITKGEFMNWTDISTPRVATLVENFFGESIQLHKRYLLQDTLRSRPVLVGYSWWINYLVEVVLVSLFIAGLWFGRRSRFMWMALSGMMLDVALHLGLGFGINEVYIMGAHWLFVVPLCIAFLVKAVEGKRQASWLRLLLLWLTVWLYVYNGMLTIGYLVR